MAAPWRTERSASDTREVAAPWCIEVNPTVSRENFCLWDCYLTQFNGGGVGAKALVG